MSCQSLLVLLVTLGFARVAAQSPYKVDFQELKTFEGIYAYHGNSTLQIAASPKDTMLYALVGTERYTLCPYSKDIFLNNGNQQVQSIRDQDRITGYMVKVLNNQISCDSIGAAYPSRTTEK